MKNAASLRAKLLALSKSKKIAFQLIIFRFLHERFLYRLSKSAFNQNFVLKGGNLIYALQYEVGRPTKDIDFLGLNIKNDRTHLESVFREILSIDVDDFVWFDCESIQSESITENNKYNGIRIYINSGFDSIQQKIQIDIGFGDIVVPEIAQLYYPVLIDVMQPILLRAYSVETIIAEKLHAMVSLSFFNSRMKDFYDVYMLLSESEIKTDQLHSAISTTFENRKLSPGKINELEDEKYIYDRNLNTRWKLFLSNNNITLNKDFDEIIKYINNKVF